MENLVDRPASTLAVYEHVAITMMAALVGGREHVGKVVDAPKNAQYLAQAAVMYADTLIKELDAGNS